MDILRTDARRFFLLGVRVFFGIWLLYAGVVKWVVFTPVKFVGLITSMFDPTWSPHALNVGLAWTILIAEPALGLLILSGVRARLVWALTSMLMFMLTFGQTMLAVAGAEKTHDVDNWHFVILTLVCAALSDPLAPRTPAAPRAA